MSDVKFDINPHVIKQLGRELVSDHVTALMELIKNAYDADANYVNVVIDTQGSYGAESHYSEEKGYIIVEDDGFGMDKDTIVSSWFVISFSNKRGVCGVKPKTPKGRTPLGDKGLGRLSTQRLANVCEIFSKRENDTPLHASFDWRDFEKVARLQDVEARVEACSFDKPKGTKLLLSGLIDKKFWEGKELERFKGVVSQMISPYKESRPFDVFLTVNKEIINISENQGKLAEASILDVDFDYSNQILTWQGKISMRMLLGNDRVDDFNRFILNDSGDNYLRSFLSGKKSQGFQRGDNGIWLTVKQEFSLQDACDDSHGAEIWDPGPFAGRIQGFAFQTNQDKVFKWDGLFKSFEAFKSFVQAQTGIKVYRNGFAVLPYGINGQDWLKLSASQTSGSSYYGLRPENVVGYVAIDEELNIHLKDKTDREGLVDNEYSRTFRKILWYLRDRINEKLEILRRDYNDYKKRFISSNSDVRTVTDAFHTIEHQVKRGLEIVKKQHKLHNELSKVEGKIEEVSKPLQPSLFEDDCVKQLSNELKAAISDVKTILSQADGILVETSALKDAVNLLRSRIETLEAQLIDFTELASLGLVSEMVSHDLGQIAMRLMERAKELSSKLDDDSLSRNDVVRAVSFIKSSVASLRKQMRHLDSSMKYRRDKITVFSITDLVNKEELEYYKAKLEKYGIEPVLIVSQDFKVRMNQGRLVQVLDNLMNNSIYWLSRLFDNKSLRPVIKIEINSPWIFFEDNGQGVDKNVEGTLFEPFVTRKPVGEGRGLGLFIVKQLLEDIGCNISLDDVRNQYDNYYRFRINMYEVIENE